MIKNIFTKSNTHESYLSNEQSRKKAINAITNQKGVIVNFDSVYAVIADGIATDKNNQFGYKYHSDYLIRKVKSKIDESMNPEQIRQELSLRGTPAMLLDPHYITSHNIVDLSRVPDDLEKFLTNPSLWTSTFGNVAFLRFPVVDSAIEFIPNYFLSSDETGLFAQIFTFSGHDLAYTFQKEIESSLQRKYYNLVLPIIAVTSANFHGDKEIITKNQAVNYWKANIKELPVLLHNKSDFRIGSYPIFSITNDGFVLIREGNLELKVFEKLFKNHIPFSIDKNLKKRVHDTIDISDEYLDYIEKIQEPKKRYVAFGNMTKGTTIAKLNEILKNLEDF